MKLTVRRSQFTFIGLFLLTLTLFGWGCQKQSAVSNQSEVGQDTAASVDVPASADTAGSMDTSALDIVKPKDLVIEDADGIKGNQKDTSPDTKVPAGWKVYESAQRKISFAYPPGWEVREDSKLGILVSDTSLPAVLPPDILGVPVVIDLRDGAKESTEDLIASLKEADPSLIIQSEVINEREVVKYIYKASINQERILYSLPSDSHFVEIGVEASTDPSIVKTLLETLSF